MGHWSIVKKAQLAALRDTLATLHERAGGRFTHVDGADAACLPGLLRAWRTPPW
jgi:hypothetical protein